MARWWPRLRRNSGAVQAADVDAALADLRAELERSIELDRRQFDLQRQVSDVNRRFLALVLALVEAQAPVLLTAMDSTPPAPRVLVVASSRDQAAIAIRELNLDRRTRTLVTSDRHHMLDGAIPDEVIWWEGWERGVFAVDARRAVERVQAKRPTWRRYTVERARVPRDPTNPSC